MIRFFLPPPSLTLRAFELSGRDSADFLKRLSTVDPANLTRGHKDPAFFLDERGHIISFFYLEKLNDDRFFIEIISQNSNFESHIEKMTFSEEMKLESLDLIPTISPSKSPTLLPMRPFETKWENKDSSLPSQMFSENEFNRLRIQSLYPIEKQELSESTNPLELGFQSAILKKQGCYPGQEVLEKINSKSEPAKRLSLLKLSQTPSQNEVSFGDHKIGTLTSRVEGLALAFIRKTHCKIGEKVHIGNATATIEKIAPFNPL